VRLLAIGRPRDGVDPRRDIAPHVADEMGALEALYLNGVVKEAYSPGGPGAVLILEVGSREHALTALATLPLAASHVIEFELIELRPFGMPGRFGARGEEAP
jgi:hypothetical protein